MKECSKETLEKATNSIYDRFSPFQSLAYWLVSSHFFFVSIYIQLFLNVYMACSCTIYYRFDLIQDYETKLGKLSKLSRTDYNSVSGCCHTKKQLEANE